MKVKYCVFFFVSFCLKKTGSSQNVWLEACLISIWPGTAFASWTVAVLMETEEHVTQAKDSTFLMLLPSNFYLTGIQDLLPCLFVSLKYCILFHLLRGTIWVAVPTRRWPCHVKPRGVQWMAVKKRQKRSQWDSRGSAVLWCPVKQLECHWTWILHRPGIADYSII